MSRLNPAARFLAGAACSLAVLWFFWTMVLLPLGWPQLSLVCSYFMKSAGEIDTYKAILMTAFRALCGMTIGFTLAVTLGILTGRTLWGWLAFFVLLMIVQKVPAIAAIHVLVSSRLGIGFTTTVTLAAFVVMTYCWQIIHHRASTLDPRETFALRVLGFRGLRLFLHAQIPHLGSALGAAARISVSMATVLVLFGEWQGIWANGTIWQHGLGIQISRSYDSIDSEARVLAYCIWLGILGLGLDFLVQAGLSTMRRIFGVDFRR